MDNAPRVMGPDAARAFIENHQRFVRMRQGTIPSARFLECMDDRQSRSEGNPDSAKYPGGGLGVAATVLATLDSLNAPRGIQFSPVMNLLEQELGGMSFHSDHHNGHDPFPAAGCGHVNGVLDNEAYGVGAYRQDLRKYADRLNTREDRHEKDIVGYSYSGDHAATAVIFIDDKTPGTYLSLPGRDEGGQAFIVNDTLNKRTLRTLAGRIERAFAPECKALGISVKKLGDTLVQTYETQLVLSLRKLAKGLPLYHAIVKGGVATFDDPHERIA
jgi:hypothetical protein